MSFSKPVLSAAAVGALALVTACSSTPSYHETRVYEAPTGNAPVYGDYGQVTSIEMIPVSARPSGAGAILGAVIGGVVGNQFGSGTGRAAMTGAGIVGGAVAGNAIERANGRDRYRVVVRLDSGGTLAVSDVGEGELRVGDRVRVVNGRVYRG